MVHKKMHCTIRCRGPLLNIVHQAWL